MFTVLLCSFAEAELFRSSAAAPANNTNLYQIHNPDDRIWDGKSDYPKFPEPWTINDERICSGYFRIGCTKDTVNEVQFHYGDHIGHADKQPMTIDVCFNFCRNITGSQFFGLEAGRDCWCSTYYVKGTDSGYCDQPCEGNSEEFCGGTNGMASLYEMHDCNNLPAQPCKNPPPFIANAKPFPSRAYRGKTSKVLLDTYCSNTIQRKGNTINNSVCLVECEPGFFIDAPENDRLRCEEKGNRLTLSWGQWVGQLFCNPVECGFPPDVAHAVRWNKKMFFNRQTEKIWYRCQIGYSLDQNATGPTSFGVHCQEDGAYARTKECLPVSCGDAPEKPHATKEFTGEGFYGDKIPYECSDGYSLDQEAAGPKSYVKTCGASGEWSETGHCQAIRCGPPPDLEHAEFVNKELSKTEPISFPNVVEYHCKKGYSHDRRKVKNDKKSENDLFEVSCTANGQFDAKEDCKAVSCGYPPSVDFASSEMRELLFEDEVTFLCDAGYTTNGLPDGPQTFRLECNHDTHWREEPKRCKPVTCKAPPTFEHAVGAPNMPAELFYLETGSYSCNPGYSTTENDNPEHRREHNFIVACQGDGTYSPAKPCVNINDCLFHDCGDGECVDKEAPNGIAKDDYHCKCNEGFEENFGNDEERKCFNINDCPPKDSFAHECALFGTCDDLLIGYGCKCNPGYHVGLLKTPAGNSTCIPEVCGEPDELPNAKFELHGRSDADRLRENTDVKATDKDVMFLGSVTYQCNEGFSLNKEIKGETKFSINCGADGSFGAKEECHPVPCGLPPSVQNADYNENAMFYAVSKEERSTTVQCIEGHTITGLASGATTFDLECSPSGAIEGTENSCKPVKCPNVPKYKHAEPAGGPAAEYHFPNNVLYRCEEGHSTDQTTSEESETFALECLPTGEFSKLSEEESPPCKPILCGPALPVNNAKHDFEDKHAVFGDVVKYEAVEGHTLDGLPAGPKTFESTCQADGTWSKTSRELPVIPVRCGEPPSRPHSTRLRDAKVYSEKARYTCDSGYSTDGKRQDKGSTPKQGNIWYEETCWADGAFSEQNACLPVSCGPARVPDNSARIVGRVAGTEDSKDTVFPQRVHFKCKPGYTTEGERDGNTNLSIACQDDGTFTAARECRNVDDCKGNKCGRNGKCIDKDTPTGNHLDDYTCECDSGFELTTKEIKGTKYHVCGNIPDCPQGACLEGGSCEDKVNDYECICGTGYWQCHGSQCTSGLKHDCEPQTCGPAPPERQHATLADASGTRGVNGAFVYPDVVSYTCDRGHTLDGSPEGQDSYTLVCTGQAGGTIREGLITGTEENHCRPVSCGIPGDIDRASLQGGSTRERVFQEDVTYECDKGHTTSGHADGPTTIHAVCSANGGLTYTDPSASRECKPVSCGVKTEADIPHATFVRMDMVFGQPITVMCHRGYYAGTQEGVKTFELVCKADGQFEPIAGCMPKKCRGRPEVAHSTNGPVDIVVFGQSVTYTCEEGHNLLGLPPAAGGGASNNSNNSNNSFEVPCLASGKFRSVTDECKPVECGPAPRIVNAEARGEESLELSLHHSKNANQKVKQHTQTMHRTQRTRRLGGNNPLVYYPAITSYTCKRGFTLTGHAGGETNFQVSCQASGTFSGERECKRVSCGVPTEVPHAEPAERGELFYEDTIRYTCAPGYSLSGGTSGGIEDKEFRRQCTSEGLLEYVGDHPNNHPDHPDHSPCQAIDWCARDYHKCGDKGRCLLPHEAPVLSYTCACSPGTKLDWTEDHKRTCVDVDECEDAHGHAHCGGESGSRGECTNGDNAYSCTCAPGYEERQGDGGAGAGSPSCEAVICGNPPHFDHASTAEIRKIRYGDEPVNYSCEDGYSTKPEDSSSCEARYFPITCTKAGTFEGEEQCRPVDCGTPPNVDHTEFLSEKRHYDQEVRYQCVPGYTISGAPGAEDGFVVRCQDHGHFSQSKECKPVRCGENPPVASAMYDVRDRYFQSQEGAGPGTSEIRYECMDGYSLTGNPVGRQDGTGTKFSTKCTKAGSFAPEVRACLQVRCGPIPPIENATHDKTEQFYQDVSTVTCFTGHTVDGKSGSENSFTVRCEADGGFVSSSARINGSGSGSESNHGSLAACVPVSCGRPSDTSFPNAKAKETTKEFHYGESTEWTCADGFSTDGTPKGASSFEQACLADGNWGDASPSGCIDIDFCLYQPCGNKGACTDCSRAPGGTCSPPQQQLALQSTSMSSTSRRHSTDASLLSSSSSSSSSHHFLATNTKKRRGGPYGTNPGNEYSCACQEGYEVKSEDGRFTCSEDDCGHNNCGPGGTCLDLSKDGQEGQYTCECIAGYRLTTKIDAETGGQEVATCARNECGLVVSTDNGFIETYNWYTDETETQGGEDEGERRARAWDEFTVRCNEGYSTDGSPACGSTSFTFKCHQSGGYFEDEQECRRVKCDNFQPPALPNMRLTGEEQFYEYGDVLEFECDVGYTLDGTPYGESKFQISCLATGEFEPPKVCRPVSCGKAPRVGHASGQHDDSDYVYEGQGIMYTCEPGHRFPRSGGGGGSHVVRSPGAEVSLRVECGPHGQFQVLAGETCSGNGGGAAAREITDCVPVECGLAPAMQGAHILSMTPSKGETSYACNESTSHPRGWDYAGCQDKTRSGRKCQRWDKQEPHEHGILHDEHNFCRSPSSDESGKGIWCYTEDPGKRWEFCDPVSQPAVDHSQQVLKYLDIATYECAPNHTVTGDSGGDTKVITRCKEDGTFTPTGSCQPVSVSVTGILEHAVHKGQLIDATITFYDSVTGVKVHEVKAKGNQYTAKIPPGTYTVLATAHKYIDSKLENSVVVRGQANSINAITMAPEMDPGQWRIVLMYNEHPVDLDSWLFMGKVKCDMDKGKQLIPNNYCPSHSCKSGWTNTKVESCTDAGGAMSSLDRDDTDSYGPETTTVTGVGQCVVCAKLDSKEKCEQHQSMCEYDPNASACREINEVPGENKCMLFFAVKKYSGRDSIFSEGGTVTVYEGSSMKKKYDLKNTVDSSSENWAPIFTIDASTGELHDGYHPLYTAEERSLPRALSNGRNAPAAREHWDDYYDHTFFHHIHARKTKKKSVRPTTNKHKTVAISAHGHSMDKKQSTSEVKKGSRSEEIHHHAF